MPAGGRAGRGGVVAQRFAVIAKTWGRSAKERSLKREEMDEPKNANDGRSNGALFSSVVGVSMQQADICFYRCTLEFSSNRSTHVVVHSKSQSAYSRAMT